MISFSTMAALITRSLTLLPAIRGDALIKPNMMGNTNFFMTPPEWPIVHFAVRKTEYHT
jgi:hypothetical protein